MVSRWQGAISFSILLHWAIVVSWSHLLSDVTVHKHITQPDQQQQLESDALLSPGDLISSITIISIWCPLQWHRKRPNCAFICSANSSRRRDSHSHHFVPVPVPLPAPILPPPPHPSASWVELRCSLADKGARDLRSITAKPWIGSSSVVPLLMAPRQCARIRRRRILIDFGQGLFCDLSFAHFLHSEIDCPELESSLFTTQTTNCYFVGSRRKEDEAWETFPSQHKKISISIIILFISQFNYRSLGLLQSQQCK